MSNIIVFPGSFNPITKAHLSIANDALKITNADKVLLVLTPDEYLNKKSLKNNSTFYYSFDDRKKIIESSIKENKNIEIWGEELGGIKPNRIKTLLTILKEHPNDQIYCILGGDKLHSLAKFLKPKNGKVSNNALKMIKSIKHIIYDRDDISSKEYIENNEYLKQYSYNFIYNKLNDDIKNISSTKVREQILNNKSLIKYVNNDAIEAIMGADKIMTNNDLYEQIENEYKNGGRHGAKNGNKLVYKDNINIFNDWQNGKDPYNFGPWKDFLDNTKLYKDEFNVNEITRNYNTITGVINEDCIVVAQNLIDNGYKTAILNLASRFNACGGYDDGMSTQEEALCRVSNLSQSLYQYMNPIGKTNKPYKRIVEANVPYKLNGYPLDINFGAIYTPNVTIFRNTQKNYFKPLEKCYKCDIISCAALNFNTFTKYQNSELIYANNSGNFNENGLKVMKNKIRTILRLAISNNDEAIILGAFGCGAFKLNPDEVANLFNEVMNETEFKNKLKVIIFAILEKKKDNNKYKEFYNLFGNYKI